ncbi:unnamed protein product, partial [Symbiodinium sp. CCMP2456]
PGASAVTKRKRNQAAAALMVAGARLDLQNSHGETAEDLAGRYSAPDFILQAFRNPEGLHSTEMARIREMSQEPTFSV